jgi:protoporphyrinogen oxidase
MSAIRRGASLRGYVGYLRRGHVSLVRAMADAVVGRGGQICLETRVREIEVESGALRRVRTNNGVMEFDLLIAALPTPVFSQLILDGDEAYRARLQESRYLGLVCPALVLNRPLSGYWTLNLTDPSSPFSSIIEMPHPQDAHYTVVYLPKYTAPENDWLGVSDQDIRDAWMLRLRQLFPDLKPDHILHFVVNRTRYVESILSLNASAQLIPVQTPYPGLFLANTGQVYPGLPTSETAITHARHVAALVMDGLHTRSNAA